MVNLYSNNYRFAICGDNLLPHSRQVQHYRQTQPAQFAHDNRAPWRWPHLRHLHPGVDGVADVTWQLGHGAGVFAVYYRPSSDLRNQFLG